MLKKRYSKLI